MQKRNYQPSSEKKETATICTLQTIYKHIHKILTY